MKRLWALLMVFSLGGFLGACGGDSSSGGGGDKSTLESGGDLDPSGTFDESHMDSLSSAVEGLLSGAGEGAVTFADPTGRMALRAGRDLFNGARFDVTRAQEGYEGMEECFDISSDGKKGTIDCDCLSGYMEKDMSGILKFSCDGDFTEEALPIYCEFEFQDVNTDGVGLDGDMAVYMDEDFFAVYFDLTITEGSYSEHVGPVMFVFSDEELIAFVLFEGDNVFIVTGFDDCYEGTGECTFLVIDEEGDHECTLSWTPGADLDDLGVDLDCGI